MEQLRFEACQICPDPLGAQATIDAKLKPRVDRFMHRYFSLTINRHNLPDLPELMPDPTLVKRAYESMLIRSGIVSCPLIGTDAVRQGTCQIVPDAGSLKNT